MRILFYLGFLEKLPNFGKAVDVWNLWTGISSILWKALALFGGLKLLIRDEDEDEESWSIWSGAGSNFWFSFFFS